jgi:cell wall-associated NlpC family hydrolase
MLRLFFTIVQLFQLSMLNAICTVAVAPVRKEPSHRVEMISQLLFGESIIVLEKKEEWVKLRSRYDGYEGWVTHHLVTETTKEVAEAPGPHVTTGLLNEINWDGIVFCIPMGCTLPAYNGVTGTLWDEAYQYRGAIRNRNEPYSKALFRSLVKQWLQAPYLWGGKTGMGVDCSGFVQVVCKVLGVPLLRDAYQQAEQGAPVENINAAKEGDLAFFKSETGRITHVGLVLEGHRIIHTSGKVRIDTLGPEGIYGDGNRQTHHLHSIRRLLHFRD